MSVGLTLMILLTPASYLLSFRFPMRLCFCFVDCVKGYYKRAKAHAAVWNEKEARRDYNMVAHLDITLASLVSRELKSLSERLKEKYWEEKEQYWNMLEKNEMREEGDEEEKRQKEDTKDEVTEEKAKEESPTGGEEVHTEGVERITVPVTDEAGGQEEVRSCEISVNDAALTEGKDWQQMLRLVMLLQDEGNFLVKENRFKEASEKFKEAIEYVDFLQKKVSEIAYIMK